MTTVPAARGPDRRLAVPELLDALLADGLISGAQRKEITIKVDVTRDKRHPLDILAGADWPDPRKAGGKLTMDVLTQWLAARHNMGWMRIDPLSIDVAKVTSVMPYAYAARVRVLPVKVTPTEITVATAEPLEREWENELARIIPQAIKRVVANPGDIERYLVEFYALARSVKASNEERRMLPAGSQNLEQLMELGRKGKLTADDQHVVAIVDWLLSYAFDSRASDIHLEPRRDSSHVRFRIDGVLHEVYQMPTPVMIAVTSRFKILSRMDVAEKRKPQDGRIKTRSPNGKEVELRASSLPTAFGEKLVMRIFDPEVLVRDFSALGFSDADADHWNDMIRAPHGIILVTGPTGSGKTTTLYTSLKQLATSEVNVCTIEDPIELVEPSFNQMQVQAGIDLTFASGVRALLRQDPDIIMIGEIRDLETAEIAIQAALTGHLVLSTLHTNDAPSAITRLLDLGVPPYLIKATLLGVVAQRLVRRLCPHCKLPSVPDPEAWSELVGSDKRVPIPAEVRQPVGCLECRETGHLGRLGLYEIMPLSTGVKRLIDRQTDIADLRRQALREGMVPLRVAGAMKIAAGQTDIEEVLGATPVVTLD
ncbi:general secretion pathway protein E [Panacagrimonas perspica]|uniref:General secretion pathway protein E n=1 Tax=Panacagrimonas perspica TaxID=381431 RepID=A0A4S3JYR1_9GAMM|nr:GspE/PulE family protein [Panacagrimonas perspica]TDU25661.1 general secretion pathway protein E [Panacagrimonas perspica]THD00722.1 type II secretion system protein E [Panacagrimonas perspica]